MEEIKRIITVDTKNSDKSIRDLKNEIKGLQKELEQTAVGSEEFNSALKKLTQTQKSYNEIQQQVRQMSRTGQQDMVRFASFAQNLGKAYSALNAAVGLFANGNEDVQKAMLKVQRTIQLVQGLEGITGLIRDLPKVANAFKGWLTSLSPIERSVNNIARGINGIDPNKLNGPNGTGGGTGGGGAAAAAAAGGGGGGVRDIDIETQALAEQTRVVTALNKEKDDATKKEKDLRSEMEKTKKAADDLSFGGRSQILISKRVADQTDNLQKRLDKLVDGYSSLDEAMKVPAIKGLSDRIKGLRAGIEGAREDGEKALKTSDELNKKYKQLSKEADDVSKSIKRLEGATKSGTSSFGSFLKTVGTTVGWTLLISTLVTLVYKVWDYITSIKTAAKEQRALNRAISEGTNQIVSKQIVVLKELALGYERVGNSAEAKAKFLENYKNKIKETGIVIEDVNKADDVFINNTSKYIDALMQRARAQAAENVAIKEYEKYLNDRYKIEEKLAETGKKLMNGAEPNYSLPMGQGMNTAYENKLNREVFDNLLKQLDEMDIKMNEKLRKIFRGIPETYDDLLDGGGAAVAKATADAGTKELEDTIKQDLEALIQYYKEAEQVLSDEMVNAKQAIMDKYAERIALAEKYGRDTIELELAREKELADLEKQFAEQAANEEYQRIQTHIEQIRRMYDTSNLREPTEQRYQTTYQQPPITRALGLVGLATGTDWINVYQSKSDVENQLKAQIEYNDQFYLLTKQRIEQENALLNQQLEIEGLSADQRLEIQRTLSENMIALSDAQLQNEQANLQAYLDAQEKRRQALNGVLDVTSTLSGAMASMFRMQAEEAEEGSKKQKAATIAYKTFAITQAIADTYKGANEAYAAMASIPYVGPALGIAAAAAAVISGIANVMAIKREEISTSTATSSQASVSAPSALNTPPIEYTRNLLGDKELDEMNQPIRCYVLEQDISNAQNKVKVTEQNASF